jgi:hypothetical protein
MSLLNISPREAEIIINNAKIAAFDKQFKKASQEIKSRIQKMITEDSKFCCMNYNIAIEVNDTSPDAEYGDKLTVYSDIATLDKWFHNLFLEELKNKPFNPIAFEQMRIKGISPKKNPRDILLIIIVSSTKKVHIGISVPDSKEYQHFDLNQFICNALMSIQTNDDTNIINIVVPDKLAFIEYATDSEVKEIDNALTLFFNQLKSDGIYKNDDSDDEYVNYLDEIDE